MVVPFAGRTLPDWSGSTSTPAICDTVVVTVFEATGFCVLPRLSWNEIEPLLLMMTPAAMPLLTVTVNCREPEPPETIVPMFQVTWLPVSVPPPVALWNVVLDGTKSDSDTLVALTLPLLLYDRV